MVYACHCRNCQKISASTFNISCIILEDSITITQGELGRVDWVADGGKKRFGEFCVKCGGRLRHGDEPSRGIYVLRGGTLDDSRYAKPAAHIWVSSKMDWVDFRDEDLLFDEQPTDYSEITSRYQAYVRSLTV
ncbi:MAG: GFA family protein [Pseudomonadota bacterium]